MIDKPMTEEELSEAENGFFDMEPHHQVLTLRELIAEVRRLQANQKLRPLLEYEKLEQENSSLRAALKKWLQGMS